MKRDRRTSFFLTLLLIFMFAVFGGGSALGIIKLPFLSSPGSASSGLAETSGHNLVESRNISPSDIQINQKSVSSETNLDLVDPNENEGQFDLPPSTDKDKSFVVELTGGTGASSSSPAATSSAPTPGQDTANSSSSPASTPADPSSSSGSAYENPSTSSGSTEIPSTRPKPPSGSGGSSHSVVVQSVTLDQREVTINRKNTLQLTATVTPQNATNKTVAWTTSNKDVATVDNTGKVIAVGAGTTTITAAAGQKSSTCEVTVVVLMDGITLNHTELSINKGSTEQLTAKITPEDTTDDKTITWASSAPDIISIDADGKVTAHKVGKATVKASAAGTTASCKVTVLSPMTGIALDKSALILDRNTTDKLMVNFLPIDTTSGREVTWSSSDTEIADVDQDGNVSAHEVGTATITARCGEFTTSCNVKVVALIHSISLNKTEITLDRNTNDQLTVSYDPPDTTDDKTVIWSTSDPTIATVDVSGKITALKIGTSTITAKIGEHTTSCNVKVVALIHSISLNKTEITLDRNTNDQLTVSYDPPDTTDDKTVTWSSSDSTVATVDSFGKVTASKIGSAIITAKVGEHTTSCSVNVVALIHSISLNKTDITLDRNTNGQLAVSYDPPDTTDDKTVTWSSSDPTVATVDSTGNVTAVQIGSTTITAQVGTHTTTCSVTVMARIHSISLDKTDLTLDRGITGQLAVVYDPPDTTDDKTVIWTSSNPTVATVDSTGKVTAVKIGSTTITATVGTHTSVCTINVEALIHSISLDKTDLTLDRGATGQLTVAYDPPDTTDDKTVIWTSSDPTVAAVDSTGKVTAVKIGSTTITATVGTHTSVCTINVEALIHSISLDKTDLTLDRGATGQLTVAYDPPDTTDDKTVIWTSSDPTVATVDSTGKVTAVKIGSTTITATVGTHTSVCTINVEALIHSISLDKTALTLDRGATGQLAVVYDPPDTTESKAIVWSSSNTSIATVDNYGKITGINNGTATITASVGTHTANCTIIVGILINNISLDKTNLTLDRGTTGQLNISINPIDTTESKAVTWSSNDSSIATVDSSGKVTGVKIGTTTITAKVGTHSTSCSIKVVALIHSISLNKTYSNLDKGGRDQLTVSFDPSDTTESKTIYWSSSNPAIASVNSSGKVTAGTSQVGETTITAKVGTHTATCVIGVGVKYTITTEEDWKSSGMSMDVFSDGSGRFTVWENDKKYKTGKGDLYIKFSKAINIPTNNNSISITFKDYDKDGSGSGTVDLYNPSPTFDNSSTLRNGKKTWNTESKNTTEVHLHFYGRVKASSKESGYVGVYWDSGSLVVFGIPITSSSGYLDL